MLTISTPAENTALTTLDEVKTQLSITETTEDTYLESAIVRGSAAICSYLNVATANDGTRTLGRETLVETYRLGDVYRYRGHKGSLLLSRYPVTAVGSVVVDGTTLDAAEYEVDGAGCLYRLTPNDVRISWCGLKITVTYTAGWLLPDDDGRTLPQDIEDATIGLIKATRFNRTRDPALRSENILESLYSYSLFAPSDKVGVLPADVASLLAPYRNVLI